MNTLYNSKKRLLKLFAILVVSLGKDIQVLAEDKASYIK